MFRIFTIKHDLKQNLCWNHLSFLSIQSKVPNQDLLVYFLLKGLSDFLWWFYLFEVGKLLCASDLIRSMLGY